jgi:hypothetical protein
MRLVVDQVTDEIKNECENEVLVYGKSRALYRSGMENVLALKSLGV